MSSGTDLATLIDRVLSERLADLRVCLPGEVVSYDPERQEADVRPLTKRSLEDRDGQAAAEDLPTLPHVPVALPRGGGMVMSLPLRAGDHVLLVFSDVSLADLRAGRGAVDPSDLATHHLGNAVAYPGGVWPDAQAISDLPSEDLLLGAPVGAGVRILIEKADEPGGGVIRAGNQSGSEDFVALAQLVLNELNAVKTAFDAHTHTVPITGPAGTTTSTPPLAPMSSPGSVAASKLKAD